MSLLECNITGNFSGALHCGGIMGACKLQRREGHSSTLPTCPAPPSGFHLMINYELSCLAHISVPDHDSNLMIIITADYDLLWGFSISVLPYPCGMRKSKSPPDRRLGCMPWNQLYSLSKAMTVISRLPNHRWFLIVEC